MNGLAKIVVGCVGLVGALASAGLAEDKVDNPLYQNWAQFKPGSYAKLKQVTEAVGTNAETIFIYTLREVTAEKIVVEKKTVVILDGQKKERPTTLLNYAAKITKEEAEKQKPRGMFAEGREEIEIAGRKIKTKWVEAEVKKDDRVSRTKLWTSEGVPGRTVKITSSRTHPLKMSSTRELVEFKADRK